MAIHTAAYQAFLLRLRQARLAAGLTQQAVAARLQRPQSFVAKSEGGDRRVDVIELQAFAQLYGKPLAWFVEGDAAAFRADGS